VLQDVDSVLDPEQVVPPLEGEGLLQSLVRDWFPPPHVKLQVPQELQAPQFPSVTHKRTDSIFKKEFLCSLSEARIHLI
jgi:hypothetical protein